MKILLVAFGLAAVALSSARSMMEFQDEEPACGLLFLTITLVNALLVAFNIMR